jgi:hypothetical protein
LAMCSTRTRRSPVGSLIFCSLKAVRLQAVRSKRAPAQWDGIRRGTRNAIRQPTEYWPEPVWTQFC